MEYMGSMAICLQRHSRCMARSLQRRAGGIRTHVLLRRPRASGHDDHCFFPLDDDCAYTSTSTSYTNTRNGGNHHASRNNLRSNTPSSTSTTTRTDEHLAHQLCRRTTSTTTTSSFPSAIMPISSRMVASSYTQAILTFITALTSVAGYSNDQ